MSKGLIPVIFFGYLCLSAACEKSTRSDREARLERVADGAHVVTDTDLEPVDEVLITAPCPSGMQHVKGNYCPQVEQTCAEWADEDKSPTANSGIGPLRCVRFSESKCVSKKREPLSFCMDTYEWPNKKGEVPPIGSTWHEAKASCESVGKRLCTAREWTFACEGEDVRPYPYDDGQGGRVGMRRDESVCDQFHDSMDPSKPRSEWPKYNHAHASGSYPNCKSQFGVYDMTANVDEWVYNEGGRADGDPYFSGLKGGYWTWKVRTRCRPMTTVHGPGFSFYQIGFRCCRDAKN